MNINSLRRQKKRFRQAFSDLFAARTVKPLPSFLNERLLRDIGLLEVDARSYQSHEVPEAEAFSEPALRDHAFSGGLTGL